ncbi:MAG: DUF2254 domain-containing protein [Pseudooceanicola sp.]|nr:DUF2254 domain-containing protein [Pseudooceanicola sp.]
MAETSGFSATLRVAFRRLREIGRRLWVRVIGIAALSLVAVLVSQLFAHLIPQGFSEAIGADSLVGLLTIIANAMLTVTTFSLTVIVTIHRSVAGQWTPRAHRIMLRDSPTQTVLATFIGAFIYSLTSLILLSTPYFGEAGVVVLFGMTLLVILLIVAMMIRWILHLQTWGSLVQTLDAIEDHAIIAFGERAQRPCHGANPLTAETVIPPRAADLHAPRTGFIQSIYEPQIDAIAGRAGAGVYLIAPPGQFVHKGEVIGHVAGGPPDLAEEIAGSIVIGKIRTPDQDPRFCLVMLSEMGSKALSPGINDPGTAIDVLGTLTRILGHYQPEAEGPPPEYPNLWLPPLDAEHLVTDAFAGIARDGAALVEVQIALQRRLAGIIAHQPALAQAARKLAADALARANKALDHPADRDRLAAAT